MSRSAVLHQFVSVRPNVYPQSRSFEWFPQFYYELQLLKGGEAGSQKRSGDTLRRLQTFYRRFGCGPDHIQSRASVLSDFQNLDFSEGELYTLPQTTQISSLKRTLLYEKFANALFSKMYPTDKRPPHHILHVTCTGYVSPSPAQILVDQRGWHEYTDVTHLYHMGCYGAMPAVRVASALVKENSDRRVDIAHTELCTLHLNLDEFSAEQAILQSLFADGAIRYSVSTGQSPRSTHGLEVVDTQELIVSGTQDLMSWKIGDSGMLMTLSRDVPDTVVLHLRRFINKLVRDSAVDNGGTGDSYKRYLFAVHPGGPRIIDRVQEKLCLTSDQVRHSVDILRNFGNMSSATLPHVWQKIVEDPDVPIGQEVISLAFGPGLTLFGSLMRKVE